MAEPFITRVTAVFYAPHHRRKQIYCHKAGLNIYQSIFPKILDHYRHHLPTTTPNFRSSCNVVDKYALPNQQDFIEKTIQPDTMKIIIILLYGFSEEYFGYL